MISQIFWPFSTDAFVGSPITPWGESFFVSAYHSTRRVPVNSR